MDNLVAEYIKYGPPNLHQRIADLLNHAAKTDEYPEELVTGLLAALPKPGKKKGPCENLRPIFLVEHTEKDFNHMSDETMLEQNPKKNSN